MWSKKKAQNLSKQLVNLPFLESEKIFLTYLFFAFSCKEVTHVFGENHQLLENVEKLGSVPLEVEIMRNADKGTPFFVTHPESKVTEVYQNIGQRLMSKFLSPNDSQSRRFQYVCIDIQEIFVIKKLKIKNPKPSYYLDKGAPVLGLIRNQRSLKLKKISAKVLCQSICPQPIHNGPVVFSTY